MVGEEMDKCPSDEMILLINESINRIDEKICMGDLDEPKTNEEYFQLVRQTYKELQDKKFYESISGK